MAYGAAIEREIRYQNEVSFGVIVDADWSDGVIFLCVEPDFTALQRKTTPNNNYRQRALATRPNIPGLRNGECGFKVYLHGRATAATEGSRSTRTTPNYPIADFMQNAWGGVRLGYCTGLASGSAAAPVVDAAAGAQYEAGDWGFFIDADTGEGEFKKILSISTDTLTMWAGHNLSFTPAAADTLGAVIQCYPSTPILVNPNHADHLTQSFLDTGDLSDDARQGLGTKLNFTALEGLAAGESPMLVFAGLVTQLLNEGIVQPTSGTPVASRQLVTSLGDDTYVQISQVGQALALVEASSVAFTPGIASKARTGPGGLEGVHGYLLEEASGDNMQIEVVVDYDDAWNTAFDAETRFQVVVTVGRTAGAAVGLACLNCELVEDPQRGAEDCSTSILRFRPLESEVATAATGSALEKVRAKAEVLLSVATA